MHNDFSTSNKIQAAKNLSAGLKSTNKSDSKSYKKLLTSPN